MLKASSEIEGVPVLLSFKIICPISWWHGPKIGNFTLVSVFLDDNPSLNSQMANKWCTKIWRVYKGCHIVFFNVVRTISMSYWPKITNLAWFQHLLRIIPVLTFTSCYEMVHKASSSTQEVLYCSSRSFIRFKWHMCKRNHLFGPDFHVSR